jgi:hypothetical protein
MKIIYQNNFIKNNKNKELKIFDREITNNELKKPITIKFENLLNSEPSNSSILSIKNNIFKINKRKISMFNNMNLIKKQFLEKQHKRSLSNLTKSASNKSNITESTKYQNNSMSHIKLNKKDKIKENAEIIVNNLLNPDKSRKHYYDIYKSNFKGFDDLIGKQQSIDPLLYITQNFRDNPNNIKIIKSYNKQIKCLGNENFRRKFFNNYNSYEETEKIKMLNKFVNNKEFDNKKEINNLFLYYFGNRRKNNKNKTKQKIIINNSSKFPKIKRFIPIEELVKNDLEDINNYCNYLNSRSVERKKLQNNLRDFFGINKM